MASPFTETPPGRFDLLHSHAVGVVGDGGGSVGENPQDADVPCQHVEYFEHVAVVVDHIRDGLIVPPAAGSYSSKPR